MDQAEKDRLEQVVAKLAAKPIVPLTKEEIEQRYYSPLQAEIAAERWNPNYRSQRGY